MTSRMALIGSDGEPTEPHGPRRQWLALSPDLVAALEQLAKREETTLEALLISLINEALAHRLQRR